VETKSESNKGATKKKELLIVDDVRLFLQLTKTMFSREEYIIHTAVNGQQAIDIAKAQIPDLILLDLHMPEIEGDEVCRHIRSEPATRHIPVVMVTSESNHDVRRRCLHAGCDNFITKPVRLDVLNQAVEKQLTVNKRNYPRVDIVLPCLLDNGMDQLLTDIHTLSAGGAYVEVDPPPLPDSDHLLTFFLPEERENISVKALARWNRFIPGNRPAGSGFEFVGAEEESLERLNQWAEAMDDNQVFS
jgi:CheY-like chemotaxis protein